MKMMFKHSSTTINKASNEHTLFEWFKKTNTLVLVLVFFRLNII